MSAPTVTCPYCHQPAPLVSGLQVYPLRRDLWAKKFYQCKACDAMVGCHPPALGDGRGGIGDGTVPLGQLANAALRRARQAAHDAFDPIWKTRRMRRRDAYAWLARQLLLRVEDCHIGHFDEQRCAQVVAAVAAWEKKSQRRSA